MLRWCKRGLRLSLVKMVQRRYIANNWYSDSPLYSVISAAASGDVEQHQHPCTRAFIPLSISFMEQTPPLPAFLSPFLNSSPLSIPSPSPYTFFFNLSFPLLLFPIPPFLFSLPFLLSLAIPPWVGTMSTNWRCSRSPLGKKR